MNVRIFFSCFFVWIIRLSTGDDLFYFDPSPVGQDVMEGDPVTLRCDVSNRHMVIFYWTLDNKVVLNGTRRYQVDSNLRIDWVDREVDTGNFRCVAANASTGAAVRSSVASLNIFYMSEDVMVQEIPSSSSSSSSQNDTISLKCLSQGNPEPAIEWFNNGMRLHSSDWIKLTRHGLRISRMASSEWGVYSCRAYNKAGSVESVQNYVHFDKTLLSADTFTRPTYTNEDDDVTLNCHFKERSMISWFFNDSKIDSDSLRHTQYDNGTLVVERFTSGDEGIYRCQVNNPNFMDVVSLSTKVVFSYIGELSDRSLDPSPSSAHVVPMTTRSEVKCYPPRGLPKPSVRWLDATGHVIRDEGRIRSKGGVLTITNADENDSGLYRCLVENMAGGEEVDVEIVVTAPPKVQRLSTVETVQEGQTATFECRFSGTAPPFTTIMWKKNGAFIETTKDERMKTTNTKLKLLNVISSDEGSYGCVITTRGHNPVHVHVTQLYVSSRLKFLPMPPVVQLEMGSVGQVPCFAEGKTHPAIFWKKIGSLQSSAINTKNLPQSSSSSSLKISQSFLTLLPDHVTSEDGVLKFKVVRKEDAGLYVCFAISTQGSINFTAKIEVIVKPHLTVRPDNVTTTEMSHLTIDCIASGEPAPSIEWIKSLRSNFIDDQRVKMSENGTLIFNEVHYEDIGWYSCHAFSETGFDKQDFYINVHDPNQLVSTTGNFWNAQKMSLVTAGCSVAYIGLMVVLVTCCLLRRRKTKKMMIMEEIGHAQKDIISAFSTSSSKSEKLSSGEVHESSRLMSPIQLEHDWTRNCSIQSFNDANPSNNLKRDRLQIISRLGRGSYGDIMLARLIPSNMSLPHFNTSQVVMVKMLHNNNKTEDNYDRLENIYDDVYCVGRKINGLGLTNYPTLMSADDDQRNFVNDFHSDQSSYNSSHNHNHHHHQRTNSVGGSTRSNPYENFRELRSRERERDEFMRDLKILRLADNEKCITRLVGSCTTLQPHIIVLEYSEKGNLRDFLQSFVPDQLPNMPFILTMDRQLHFCHQVALGMLKLNEVVNDNTSTHGNRHSFMPLKHLAARNVVVMACLDAKISMDGPCFNLNNPKELDEDHIWHDSRPLMLRWSAPEILSQKNRVLNSCLCNISLPSSSLSHSIAKSTTTHWPSDVWSYGMLVMEIFTFAARPFNDLTDSQVLSKLLHLSEICHSNLSTISSGDPRKDALQTSFTRFDAANVGGQFFTPLGIRCPLGCPESMWQIISQCLSPLPRERPTFEKIVKDVELIIRYVSRLS